MVAPSSGGVSLVGEIVRTLDAAGVDLAALGLAWARVTPTVALVPAFGLRALPAPVRGALALALALSIFPALVPLAASRAGAPWPLLALEEILRGLPVAVAAAVPLWAATMAGGIVDALRGAQESAALATVEGRATPSGALLALLASALFLAGGGAARVVRVLIVADVPERPVLLAIHDIVGGVVVAVAIAGPLLAASVVIEIAGALVARASSPAQIHALLAPVRALGILAALALVLDRMAALLF